MLVKENTKMAEIDCCPSMRKSDNCDSIDIKYRLPFRPRVGNDSVTVEVLLHFRFERCSEGISLGDLVYSTTLFPREKVRLFTSDRHSRWSFDSETNLAYRHETTSEEAYLMAGMASSMSDLTITEGGGSVSTYNEASVSGGGGAGIDLGIIEIGGGVSGSSFNAVATNAFARNFSQHAESSSRHVEAGIRAASSTSVGEVERRQHAEGESESHFEASSRLFENPNRCHSLTYLFYKLVKCQKFKFELVAIERRVVDPIAPTGATRAPFNPSNKLTVRPQTVLASSAKRLDLERNARTSADEFVLSKGPVATRTGFDTRFVAAAGTRDIAPPIPAKMHEEALDAVDKDLIQVGLLDKDSRTVSKKAIARFSWERKTSLPTAGVLVKGCLDECNICEPQLLEEIKIDLERKRLENDLLKKRTELLEKSHEYRCCPAGEVEEGGDDDD